MPISISTQIKQLVQSAKTELNSVQSLTQLELVRVKYLGRKGKLKQISRTFPQLSTQQRQSAGRKLNRAKQTIAKQLASTGQKLAQPQNKTNIKDPTLPGQPALPLGHYHPLTQAIDEISQIFERLGFEISSYPEVDNDWYPFEGLNMPPNHPARDEWETYFLLNGSILTPHTSNGQLREMERLGQPPIRMINIGKCYRRQSDISHGTMFFQFEGLVVDKHIAISHLKGTFDYFFKAYYGTQRVSRLRPFHFQFTEPSFEVDISCDLCHGTGRLKRGQKCRLCKSGWLELGGAGMVHPTVLKNGGIDPNKYTGYAFGFGIERTFMMKNNLNIPDIRQFYSNDTRFLNQF